MLTAIQVIDSVYAGWADLPNEWQILSFRDDERGTALSVRSYDSRDGAITAAQWMRATENPKADLAVYCGQCHRRCSYLFGYICDACNAAAVTS